MNDGGERIIRTHLALGPRLEHHPELVIRQALGGGRAGLLQRQRHALQHACLLPQLALEHTRVSLGRGLPPPLLRRTEQGMARRARRRSWLMIVIIIVLRPLLPAAPGQDADPGAHHLHTYRHHPAAHTRTSTDLHRRAGGRTSAVSMRKMSGRAMRLTVLVCGSQEGVTS